MVFSDHEMHPLVLHPRLHQLRVDWSRRRNLLPQERKRLKGLGSHAQRQSGQRLRGRAKGRRSKLEFLLRLSRQQRRTGESQGRGLRRSLPEDCELHKLLLEPGQRRNVLLQERRQNNGRFVSGRRSRKCLRNYSGKDGNSEVKNFVEKFSQFCSSLRFRWKRSEECSNRDRRMPRSVFDHSEMHSLCLVRTFEIIDHFTIYNVNISINSTEQFSVLFDDFQNNVQKFDNWIYF